MENLPLILGLLAAGLVLFWLFKKAVKLALFFALLGAAAWIWYFNIR